MSDNAAVTCVLNVALCGASVFGFIKLGPSEHPCAFAACLIGFCNGLMGAVRALVDDETARKIQNTTSNLMEIFPLPLVNIDLYLKAESNNIALGHGLFMVPLAVTAILGLIKGDGSEDTEDIGPMGTLKTLAILGNITSLVYLAINESSFNLGGMAVLAFTAHFGASFFEENVAYNSGEPVSYLSWTGFYILAALAGSGEK